MTPRQKFDTDRLPERPHLEYETELWAQGVHWVAGVDEAGRGALAGPVAAGAVILPYGQLDLMDRLQGVRDSKVMTPADRTFWAAKIKAAAYVWGVGMATAKEIDRLGILPATRLAAVRALDKLGLSAEHILIDYLTLPEIPIPQTPLVKGDARSLTIASAAILAKTARDAILVEMEGSFPGYAFAYNKGYATVAHRQAIEVLGPCSQHRRTFAPISAYDSLFPPEKNRG